MAFRPLPIGVDNFEKLITTVKEWYDGYRFGNAHVYKKKRTYLLERGE